jgi:integration host factor subunit beta
MSLKKAQKKKKNKMKKSDLLNNLKSKLSNFSQTDITISLDHILKSFQDALKKEERIEIRGFGSLSVRRRKAIRARNPQSGDSIELSERKIPYFRAAKSLKAKIN